MPFWKCYYHAVWATIGRQPLLTLELETVVIETIKRKSNALDCPILAINGTADHIHIAVSITPGVSVAEWIRSVKEYQPTKSTRYSPIYPHPSNGRKVMVS